MRVNAWKQIVFEKPDLEELIKGNVALENFIKCLDQFEIYLDINSNMIFASVSIKKEGVKPDWPALIAYRWKNGIVTYNTLAQKFESEMSKRIFEDLDGYSNVQIIAAFAAKALDDL